VFVLPASQCPRCVLRFGSKSELYQHLRLDHKPAADVPVPHENPSEPVLAEPRPAPPADRVIEKNRFLTRMIATAVVLAFVAVLSWHVAALMSVAVIATVALRSSPRRHSNTHLEDR